MPPADDLADCIAEFLDAHHVMSLATCGPHGPHAANVDRQSTHSTNIGINPQVSATIAPDYRNFAEICGVQIFGRAHQFSQPAARYKARALLARRYPILQHPSDPMIEQAYSSAEPYQLVPNRIVLIDNRHGFGHKETLDLQP